MKTIINMNTGETVEIYFDIVEMEKGDNGRNADNGFLCQNFKAGTFAIKFFRNTSDSPKNYKIISKKTVDILDAMNWEEYIQECSNICF